MGNVIAFKAALAKRAAENMRAKQLSKDIQGKGTISFTDMGDGTSRMRLSGSYAQHTQFGIYTLITGLMGLANKVVDSGNVGHHSEKDIQESLKIRHGQPKRLRNWTDFSDLK